MGSPLLSQRSLSTNIPNGSLDLYDIGYRANDWNDLTDENGNIVFVEAGATNEWKRMIEWMDGDGVVHQEEASITLSITSSWGTFSQTIDAPTTAEGSMELALPYVAVTSVSPNRPRPWPTRASLAWSASRTPVMRMFQA